MARREQRSFRGIPTPDQRRFADKLESYVDTIFRPIRVCAQGKERDDIQRVQDAFLRKFTMKYLATPDPQALQDGLAQAVRLIQAVDLLTFHPQEFLAGFDIGKESARRWIRVVGERGQLYPRDLVEARIAKAKLALDRDARAALEEDYPPEWPDDDSYGKDMKALLDRETEWIQRVLPQLREKHSNFERAPQWVQRLDKDLEEHQKNCRLSLNTWQNAQQVESETDRAAAIENWKERCRSLYRHARTLRARTRAYFDIVD